MKFRSSECQTRRSMSFDSPFLEFQLSTVGTNNFLKSQSPLHRISGTVSLYCMLTDSGFLSEFPGIPSPRIQESRIILRSGILSSATLRMHTVQDSGRIARVCSCLRKGAWSFDCFTGTREMSVYTARSHKRPNQAISLRTHTFCVFTRFVWSVSRVCVPRHAAPLRVSVDAWAVQASYRPACDESRTGASPGRATREPHITVVLMFLPPPSSVTHSS